MSRRSTREQNEWKVPSVTLRAAATGTILFRRSLISRAALLVKVTPRIDDEFDAMCGDCACNYVIGQGVFADFENPVCSAAAVWTGEGYHLAVKDA